MFCFTNLIYLFTIEFLLLCCKVIANGWSNIPKSVLYSSTVKTNFVHRSNDDYDLEKVGFIYFKSKIQKGKESKVHQIELTYSTEQRILVSVFVFNKGIMALH